MFAKNDTLDKITPKLRFMLDWATNSEDHEQLIDINRKLRRQLYELHNLLEISLDLNSKLNETQLIHSYWLNLFGLLSTKSVVILTNSNPYAKLFSAQYYKGIRPDHAQLLKIKKSDPIFEIFKENHKVITVKNKNFKKTNPEFFKVVESIGGVLITPLIHRQNILGLVIIGEKHGEKPYTEPEIDSFSLLTTFLAVALTNSRLYKEMKRVSLTDPLTGLFNRRYFENYLQAEIARARRFSHPLSLVMLDVDYFKNYNDRLGHPTGDILLKQLANLLTKTVRCSDMVARYGGEEFCVILPEISSHGALSFSERLRDVVFSHPFNKREIQPIGRITISVGAATYPSDAHMTKELIVKADTALYQAKNNGRNQVAVYGQIE
jgi:diguanylate cyclase (GGDEF)-like protein